MDPLGIGIDCGTVDLVTNQGGLTVVGPPVVYACRYGGAPAHTTLLNQQAYRKIFDKYSANCSFVRTSIQIKNDSTSVAYRVTLNEKEFKPKVPPWLEESAAASAPPK